MLLVRKERQKKGERERVEGNELQIISVLAYNNSHPYTLVSLYLPISIFYIFLLIFILLSFFPPPVHFLSSCTLLLSFPVLPASALSPFKKIFLSPTPHPTYRAEFTNSA